MAHDDTLSRLKAEEACQVQEKSEAKNMEETIENEGAGGSDGDITPKLYRIKGGSGDASQKLNHAINIPNDAVQRNFMSRFSPSWQSTVAN